MAEELVGKVAVVTGGAGGIGRGIVEVLLEEGAKVVIADIDLERGEQVAAELGESVAFHETDVSDADSVQAMVDFTAGRFGGLHVFVNNAGISSKSLGLLRDDLRDFDRIIAVNLFGVMVGTQRAARHMAENGGGTIINITSIGGINPGAGLMTYRATKAAVIHFTRSAAIDLAPNDIRVNCIAPAHIPTELNSWYSVETIVQNMQPLQRVGSPRDVGNAVMYLASDRAAQITGIVMPVDGGTTAGRPVGETKKFLAAKAPHGKDS